MATLYNDAAGSLTHPGKLHKGRVHYPVRCSPAELEMLAYKTKMRSPDVAK